MFDLPLHPKIVHLPIALAVLLPLLSVGVLIAWWRGWFRRRTWIIVIAAHVMLLVSGFVAMNSGESDEEAVEKIVNEAAIEAHEEAAKMFMIIAGVAGATALVVVFLRNEKFAKYAAAVACVASVGVLAAGGNVGSSGGSLVYKHGAANAHVQAQPAVKSSK